MGTYCYRITSTKHTCSDGTQANVAIYAYKPSFSWIDAEKFNARAHFKSGALSSDNLAKRGKFDQCRVVLGKKTDDGRIEVYRDEAVYLNVANVGTFYDDGMGRAYLPKIDGVKS